MGMNIKKVVFHLDTKWVMDGQFTANDLAEGHSRIDTPIFDRLAADYFASDKTTFNLGDYR